MFLLMLTPCSILASPIFPAQKYSLYGLRFSWKTLILQAKLFIWNKRSNRCFGLRLACICRYICPVPKLPCIFPQSNHTKHNNDYVTLLFRYIWWHHTIYRKIWIGILAFKASVQDCSPIFISNLIYLPYASVRENSLFS